MAAGEERLSTCTPSLENAPEGCANTDASLHCIADRHLFDPACGSGNFLTESYLSLRRLENDILRELQKDTDLGLLQLNFVTIDQFYGIEINDFAVAVCKTALWIAEAQMLAETEEIVQRSIDFFPLTTNSNIHEGNALRMDWKTVVAPGDDVKIMGIPCSDLRARLLSLPCISSQICTRTAC